MLLFLLDFFVYIHNSSLVALWILSLYDLWGVPCKGYCMHIGRTKSPACFGTPWVPSTGATHAG